MRVMTPEEKAAFCSFVSVVLAQPEKDTMSVLKDSAFSDWIATGANRWTDAPVFIEGLFGPAQSPDGLADLQAAYERLFDPLNGQGISLVESTYKPWTESADCGMVFAAETGLLMGDSAVHMNALYSAAAIEVPPEFRSMPDHLVLELEFLSMLYESASDEKAKVFIDAHLDWICLLKDKVEKADPHPFYQSAVGLLNVFINHERNAGKELNHGTTNVH